MTAQASDPLSGSVLPTGGGSESPIGNTCLPPTTRFPVPPSTDVAVTALDAQNSPTPIRSSSRSYLTQPSCPKHEISHYVRASWSLCSTVRRESGSVAAV